MLPITAVKIVCKVFDNEVAPETYESYTIEGTSFNFSLSWSNEFTDRDFYSNNTIIWDFGDGTNYTGASAKHYYKYPSNSYEVYATIFDKNGDVFKITLNEKLTAKNIFPDYLYLNPLNPNGRSYNLPAGKASDQIIVTRYNSWQNEKFLKENDYSINLYVSGCKSDHITLSAYYSEKYSHLKAYHGFVSVTVNSDNYIETRVVESTRTNSVSVYAIPYSTGLVDGDWNIKFNFYNYNVNGSFFIGSSGSNYDIDTIYFVDQKASDGINVVYASFDSKNLNDYDIDANNLSKLFQKYDQGYMNLPWSGQLFKSIFNSASTLRITSNGISLEGYNTTVGKLTGQISYPFDIYPIKWTNSNIPFVLNFRDDENYSVKTYPPIYNFHTGEFNDQLNDVNLKLVQFSDTNPTFNFSPSNVIELKDAVFLKNEKVPQYDDSPYFAGLVSLPYESKVLAISATVKIQDTPVAKLYPIYGYMSQIGVPKIKRYEKVSVFDHCNTSELDFYYKQNLSTFTNTSTANVHISFSPLSFLDESKNSRVFILDADNEKIYKTDIGGNIVSIMDLSSMYYSEDNVKAPVLRSFLNSNNVATPIWCCTDKNGNAYVSLADNVSAIKINYETDIVSQIYAPPLENLELYDSDLYPESGKTIVTINGSKKITTISNASTKIVTIKKYDQYFGFVGENSIIPSCIDVDIDDNVYVAYTHPLSNFICKYANDGSLITTIYFNHLEVPQEIIIDSDNNIWVGIENINKSSTVNLDREDVVYFIDGVTYNKTIIRGIEGFGMMTIDAEQNIYVLNKTNTVTKINSNTKTAKDYVFGTTSDENPYLKDIGGIAVDSSGDIWIINNVDGKLYFGDTKNMNKSLSSLPFEKLKDLNLKTINDLASIYFVMGDWTGFRWINKFIRTEISKPRIISGISTYFDILEPSPTIVKKGEDFDSLTQIKSYISQESLFNKKTLLDDFMGQILGKNENVEEIGKVIYEKIDNFVGNTSDLDTCNIQELISLAEETGTDLNEYVLSYPPSVRRALNLLSISQRRLFGTPNSYDRDISPIDSLYVENSNIGKLIEIETGTFVAGNPIITYELFSEKANLVKNTIVENYNAGDVVPLSSINYEWGWGLVTATREQSGMELNQYYNFYEYVPNKYIEIYDNIIDFDSKLTTLTPQESSFKDWSKFGGNMDKILSYGLYKGLKMIK